MVIVSFGVFIFYLLLAFLSRKELVEKETKRVLRPFYRMAGYLYKKACRYSIKLFYSAQVETDLERLYIGDRREQLKTEYYERKLALCLLIGLIGTVIALAADRQSVASTTVTANGVIERNEYTDGGNSLEITASASDRKIGSFQVEVAPKKLTKAEADTLHAKFLEELPEYMRNKNPSMSEVYSDLNLPETLPGYLFQVEWSSDMLGVVSATGNVYPPEEGCIEVILTALVTYEEMQWIDVFPVQVVQIPLSAGEQEYNQLQVFLTEAEENSRDKREWQLPTMWQGENIVWKQVQENYGYFLWGLSITCAAAVFWLSDLDLHEKLEEKRKRMKQEYPDIVHKLALYFGAGMTVRGAFQRIAGDYEQEKKEGGRNRPAYEQMLYTCRELQSGVSEGAAYEHFGRRTGLQEYIRLSTFLMQNLKKGNSALLERLREEAAKTYNERMQNGRRLGEEAVTKLLLPMIMMLVVVMIMVMLPAFSAMEG